MQEEDILQPAHERDGSRLFSRYHTRRDDGLWIITEWDCRVTTLLLPEDY